MKKRSNIALSCMLMLALLLVGMCEAQDWRSEDFHDDIIVAKAPFHCGREGMESTFAEVEEYNSGGTFSDVFRAGAAAEDRERDFRSLRMLVSSDDLDDPTKYCAEEGGLASNFGGGTEVCEEGDILTAYRRRMFLEVTFPIGQEKHQSHLMVRRSLVRMKNSSCGNFAVPKYHYDPGFLNIDFIAYVGVGKNSLADAWGGPCGGFQGRQAMGQQFFNTGFGNPDSDNVMVHEVGHAIGMGGGPSPRELELRENPYAVVSGGKHARQRGNFQYNWSINPGPEYQGRDPLDENFTLEEQEPSMGHWLSRNLGGEYMGCLGPCDYGQVGMGQMRDLEVFRVRYDRAVFMPMAYKQGPEDHHEKKCGIEGIPQADSFCGIEDRDFCHFDRAEGFGYCEMEVAPIPIPSFLQYFTDPSLMGTSADLGDLCPFISRSRSCKGSFSWSAAGSMSGPNGVCLNTNYSEIGERLIVGSTEVSAICAVADCNLDTLTYQLLFLGERHYIPCPQLEVLDMSKYTEEFTFGKLQCPLYYSVCGREDFNTKNAALPSALVASKHGILPTIILVVFVFITLL